MASLGTISRRNFLVAGVAVGTIGLLGAESASAVPESLGRLVKDDDLGVLSYIQLHCSEDFSLSQALSVVETLTQGIELEKVGALGAPEFVGAPKDVLVTLYYKGGLRATITSGKSALPSLGTVRSTDGDVLIHDERMEVFDKEGRLQQSFIFESQRVGVTHRLLELVIRSLQEGKTIFPGE